MNDEPIALTREGLRDGSLLASARRRAPPGTVFKSDAEIEADLDRTLSSHPLGEDVFLFGYGSLMWNPAFHFAERRAGSVRGWHRRFCLWLHMGRATPANPGLMLALERGGICQGALFRFPAHQAREELLLAWRREMFSDAYLSRWVTVATDSGPVRAATFVVNRAHKRYAGRLDDARIARHLVTATGSLGSCASYLAETIGALEGLGVRDRSMERLHRLVTRSAAPGS